jgi:hypothetical protein
LIGQGRALILLFNEEFDEWLILQLRSSIILSSHIFLTFTFCKIVLTDVYIVTEPKKIFKMQKQ